VPDDFGFAISQAEHLRGSQLERGGLDQATREQMLAFAAGLADLLS
jgi:hypothetical protein